MNKPKLIDSTHSRYVFWRKLVSVKTKLCSLVVEHDVREPDVGGGHVEAVHAPVLLRVPAELVIKPVLLDPEVSRHHLLAEVLSWMETINFL